MRHVFAQTHIANHDQVADLLLDSASCALHDAIIGPGAGGHFIFRFREAKQDDGAKAQGFAFSRLLDRFINREVKDSGHGRDFPPHSFPRTHKQWIDKVFWSEPGFAHKRAQQLGLAHASEPGDWEGHWVKSTGFLSISVLLHHRKSVESVSSLVGFLRYYR